jgi:hypothetical protein
VMIQLIDQSNPAQGLVYRCLGCLAEFISAPPLLDEHQCGKPDDDPKRGIRPYVRVAKSATPQQGEENGRDVGYHSAAREPARREAKAETGYTR